MSEPSKKRIVFVLPTLLAGGAERVLITLMNGIDRARFEPMLVVLDERGTLRDLIAKDIPLHALGGLTLKKALPGLIKKLNQLAPDVIVSTMAGTNFVVLLAKPFLKKRARVIVREAVIPSSILDTQKFPGIVKAAYKALYPRADIVISPAQCIIDEFKNLLKMKTDKHVLLYNPVDTDRIFSTWGIDTGIPPERREKAQFVASGRLHKQKGFDRLIEGLQNFKGGKWQLTILGEGPERRNLESLIAQHRLEKNVKLAGHIDEPWPLYGAADAFLLPSRWEGLPNVALEALACGTPVIAMREAGGIEEIAELAGKETVRVADTMNDFIHAMENVQPNPTESYRPSLLPSDFNHNSVAEKFEALL